MYEESQENLFVRPQKRSQSGRRFGTDLTKGTVNRRSLKPVKKAQSVEDMTEESFKILHNTESNHMASASYMALQFDINEQMRSILIDWLVTVQHKFRFAGETLFLTINILDRFLEKNIILRKELQLAGICAMYIAAKYEESIVPEIKDLVYISANAYNRQEIINMEIKILKDLNFTVTVASPLKFYERYAGVLALEKSFYFLGRYFLELVLGEYTFLRYRPSMIAASCIYLVEKLRKREKNIEIESINYYYSEIRDCVVEIIATIDKASSNSLQGVRYKYFDEEFKGVAKISVDHFRINNDIV